MNGNTAVLPERLLECGMNTVYPGMPFVSGAACANIVSASKAKQSKAKQSKAKQSKAHRFRLTFARPVVSSRVHESYYFATPRNEALQLRSGFVFSQQAAQPENARTDRK